MVGLALPYKTGATEGVKSAALAGRHSEADEREQAIHEANVGKPDDKREGGRGDQVFEEVQVRDKGSNQDCGFCYRTC